LKASEVVAALAIDEGNIYSYIGICQAKKQLPKKIRPDSILRKLLYNGFKIHPARRTMDEYLVGMPLRARE
jgi:hypothetical protein